MTEDDSRSTTFQSESRGRQRFRTLPAGNTEEFRYDDRGRQYLHISFEGVVTETLFDDSPTGGGRVLRRDLFANETDYGDFKNSGNLASSVNWERIRMSYDAFGRIVQNEHIHASGASAGNPLSPVIDAWTCGYDPRGRLIQESSPTGFIKYEYDALGRKVKMQAGTSSPTVLSEFTYDYDGFGRLSNVSTTVRDGAVVDADGNSSNGNQPETTDYHYDLLGRPDYTELPHGVVEDFTFDSMDYIYNELMGNAAEEKTDK